MTERVTSNVVLDRLKKELSNYAKARAEQAMSGAVNRVEGMATRLADPTAGISGLFGGSPGRAAVKGLGSMVKSGIGEKLRKVTGQGKTRGSRAAGTGKATEIIEDLNIAVPVRDVYNQWTRLSEFARFTRGVEGVDQKDETESVWHVKVAKCRRSWVAHVMEQIPDQRIAWTSEGAKGTTKGAVTFHPQGDHITRVLLVLEYFPRGPVERIGNLWRAQGRRARLDLKLFRAYVTTQNEIPEGWRGEIHDGEVTREHEDEEETGKEPAEESAEDGAYAEEEEEGYDDEERYQDEPYDEEAEEGEQDKDSYEEEPEEDTEHEPAEHEDDRGGRNGHPASSGTRRRTSAKR
jgi:uncharacterized membrane protein